MHWLKPPKPFLGDFGFRLIAIGALFSTASAINATLFGAANVSYMIARDGELLSFFMEIAAKRDRRALYHCCSCDLVHSVFRSLRIAMMGSGAFLLIYACVHAAHLKVAHETGGSKLIVSLSLATCLAMLGVLAVYIYQNSRQALVTMIVLIPVCLIAELIYRRTTGRSLKTRR